MHLEWLHLRFAPSDPKLLQLPSSVQRYKPPSHAPGNFHCSCPQVHAQYIHQFFLNDRFFTMQSWHLPILCSPFRPRIAARSVVTPLGTPSSETRCWAAKASPIVSRTRAAQAPWSTRTSQPGDVRDGFTRADQKGIKIRQNRLTQKVLLEI